MLSRINNRGGAGSGRGSLRWAVLLLAITWMATGAARASVSLLLEQPYGSGMVVFNPTGHSALYFDHICAATPVTLRPCGPGELGTVISRYDGVGGFDWIAVPLVPYLYAVESADEIPSTVDKLDTQRLREVYRRDHLEEVAPDTATGDTPKGNWYELVGSAYDRSIYGFRIKTDPKQDAQLIAYFNDRRNVAEYNGAFNNCADFTRVVLNRIYPHAVRRNFIGDFGITSPKSVARALTHYALKHPALEFQTFTVPQVKGSLPRSRDVEGVTESLLKRYGLPLILLSPHASAVVLVAYVGRGRFALPKKSPVLDVAELERSANDELRLASLDKVSGPPVAAGESGGVRVSAAGLDPAVLLPAFGGGVSEAAFFTGVECNECEAVPFLP